MTKKAVMYADGGSRGNPGAAASGAVLYEDVNGQLQEIGRASKYLGVATNNVAEYTAIIIGLEAAAERGVREIDVRLDSELAVRQILGEYRVKNEGLKPLFHQVKACMDDFDRITFKHVRREENKEADALVNEVLDSHARG